MARAVFWLFAIVVSATACRATSTPAPPNAAAGSSQTTSTSTANAAEPVDVHSRARPQQVVVEHMGLDLDISFADRTLGGEVTLAVARIMPDAPLRLDIRDLEIERVEVGHRPPNAETLAGLPDAAGWQATKWSLQDDDPILGQALVVELPADIDLVRIAYRTGPDASGLQWLEPSQTAEKTHPFLYSQSQAIHARSWIPCQDTPSVRVTYDATIEVDDDLTALMAAQRVGAKNGRFSFEMPQPIPAYLIALAVGRLEYAEVGPRTGVWAEPSVLPRARHEFVDMEAMLQTAERLYGPYRWGRYDVLVLPPAFPFGGMENPRLTFATPTILAGDRSLIALVAHELAHSWSGNLVTNATWSDLWLNEGFTVYIERRLVEALYGRARSRMEAALGRRDLDEALDELAEADEALYVDLKGRDPDDGLSDVAYEKGALFLTTLEHAYGREAFDAFLEKWFDAHAFTSVTTQEFLAFLRRELTEPKQPTAGAQPPSIDAWVYGPGVPEGVPNEDVDAFVAVDRAVETFSAGGSAAKLPTRQWTPHHWLHFLRTLPDDLPPRRLAALDRAHSLTESQNYEILAQWLELAVRHGYRRVDARLEAFLLEVGRRKFLMPLYRSLLESGRREDAQRIYARARAGYHPISQGSIDALLAGS